MKIINAYLKHSPTDKILIGKIAEHRQRIHFQYSPDFLAQSIWLSPYKLPLQSDSFEFKNKDFGQIFGLFNDSLPDGWGMLLMDRYLEEKGVNLDTFSILDRLTFLGDSTMGALVYEPAMEHDQYNFLVDLQGIAEESRKILESDAKVLPELMMMGGSPQGAKPKVLIGLKSDQLVSGMNDLPDGFEHWLVKFPSKDDFHDSGRVEYAYSLMARNCGIRMPETRLFEVSTGDAYFGIKRFDRQHNNRFHTHSLGGLIHSNFRLPECDYKTFLRVVSDLTKNHQDIIRGFQQMVFNIITNNRDDHVKNFAFMIGADGEWTLTPAYDLIFAKGPGGEHSMSVAGEGRSPGIAQVQRLGLDVGLKKNKIQEIVDQISDACRQWRDYADQSGVSDKSVKYIQKKINENLANFD